MNTIISFFHKKSWYVLVSMLLLSTFLGCKSDNLEYRSEAIIMKFPKNIELGAVDTHLTQKNYKDLSFNNLIAFMKSRNIIKFLTYCLLIHDLKETQKEIEKTPFRTMKENPDFQLSSYELDSLINYMEMRVDSFAEIDEKKEKDLEAIAISFGYDHESLLTHFIIERKGESDYLQLDFTSENAALSHFALSNYCYDLFRYYEYLQTKDLKENIAFYNDRIHQEQLRNESLNGNKADLDDMKEGLNVAKLKLKHTKMPLKLIQKATYPK